MTHLLDTRAWYHAQHLRLLLRRPGTTFRARCRNRQYYYSNIFDKTVKQTAIFGEVTYTLTDRWSVTGGARWFEYDRKEFDIYQVPRRACRLFGSDELPAAATGATGKSSDTVLQVRHGIPLRPRTSMVYVLFSQGFRLGGNNSVRAAATGLIPLDYEPDKMNNYEIGLKSQWLDNRLQLNVTAFLMKWDDIQLNVSLQSLGGCAARSTAARRSRRASRSTAT